MIEKDIMTALKLMILTFTFYKIGEKMSQTKFIELENPDIYEKHFLQIVIKEHPLWNMPEFWEAGIFSSIKEELNNQKNYLFGHEESNDDTLIRERNIVFGQLASYCNNMLMFHIEKNVVKDIIGNFCKRYNLFDSQTKDLQVLNYEKILIILLFVY